MGALSLIGSALTITVAGTSPPDRVAHWQSFIAEAAQRFTIPIPWIKRVMIAESGGHMSLAGVPIRSRAGAIGLMQLMPETWADMRRTYRLGGDPDDPHDNIIAGTAYLRLMYDRFGYPGLFAAYNAGPARYSSSLATGRRLPQETLVYLAQVSGQSQSTPSARKSEVMQSLFVVHHDESVGARLPEDHPAEPSLFAIRSVTP